VNLGGRTVLLTGASGGLGQAIARALAGRGARLVLTARRAEVLDALAAETGGRALPCDLADRAALERLVADAGPVDVLVANAGLPASGGIWSFSVEQIDRALDVNLRAPMVLARLLSDGMAERGGGQIVFVSSLSGKAGTPKTSVYAATKFGLRGFAFCLRDDLRSTGVGVSVISPGLIREAGMYAESGAPPPPGVGMGRPEQVGAAVVKAIERDRREITVAPLRQRVLAQIAINAPELSGRVAGGLAARVADEVARGQTHKR
jgi:short-subunit dehydrogenase